MVSNKRHGRGACATCFRDGRNLWPGSIRLKSRHSEIKIDVLQYAMPEKTLSQQTFDRMQELIQEIKSRSLEAENRELWGLADRLYAELRRFVTDLEVEGRFPELGSKG